MKYITFVDITHISFHKFHFSIILQFGLSVQSEGKNIGTVHMERERERGGGRDVSRSERGFCRIFGEFSAIQFSVLLAAARPLQNKREHKVPLTDRPTHVQTGHKTLQRQKMQSLFEGNPKEVVVVINVGYVSNLTREQDSQHAHSTYSQHAVCAELLFDTRKETSVQSNRV